MTQKQLSQAKDKDLPASLIALRRAARAARQIALSTGTAIIVHRGNKTVRITAEELRGSGVNQDSTI